MAGLINEIAAVVVLLCLLVVVIVKPRGVPEGLAGFAGALLLVAIGATTVTAAVSQIGELMPTALFLGACLILAGLCEREGLFSYLGRKRSGFRTAIPCDCFCCHFSCARQ